VANEDRTEQPTQKRKQETRRKGQVARSTEVNSALILMAGYLLLKNLGPWLGQQALNFSSQTLSMMGQDWNSGTPGRLLSLSAVAVARLLLPLFAVTLAAGCVAGLAQVGFLFTPDNLAPKLERINPLEGFKRIFSRRALVELLKSIAKVAVIGYLAYGVIRPNLAVFPQLTEMGVGGAVSELARLASAIILRIGVFLIILAVVDYLFQYSENQKLIRMTKQELKEEMRQTEGDPQIRGRLRQRQRMLAQQRMMQQVPQADVVITNPTHFAVALRYELRRDSAPVVVAKGADEIAQRIKQIAREHDVVIFEDPPLAQTLYKTVELGRAIPEQLYEAVANVLSFVYRLRPYNFRDKGLR
jgi:flagellar biosynthetic protein FlhB